MNSSENTYATVQEIRQLIQKQQMLEDELNELKSSLSNVQQSNEEAISRIESIEKEIAQMSISIDNVVASVDRVQKTINNVYKAVGKIEGKQDKTIEVQENFISQLWKAFFAILALVTTGSGVIFTLMNK